MKAYPVIVPGHYIGRGSLGLEGERGDDAVGSASTSQGLLKSNKY